MNRRVVVTGMGVISALGRNSAEFWAALCEGRSGIAPLESVNVSKFRFQNGAEVRSYHWDAYFSDSESRFLDRFTQFALIAARDALSDSGIDLSPNLLEKTAVVTGSCVGGQSTEDVGFSDLYRCNRDRVHPLTNYSADDVQRRRELHLDEKWHHRARLHSINCLFLFQPCNWASVLDGAKWSRRVGRYRR
jgi:3-oxoacyl-(acyl-carrier-protein) synthase